MTNFSASRIVINPIAVNPTTIFTEDEINHFNNISIVNLTKVNHKSIYFTLPSDYRGNTIHYAIYKNTDANGKTYFVFRRFIKNLFWGYSEAQVYQLFRTNGIHQEFETINAAIDKLITYNVKLVNRAI